MAQKPTFAAAVRARTETRCPDCNERKLAHAVLAHLALRHGWSVSRMADWLERTFRS